MASTNGELEISESPDTFMEDVAPQRWQAQRFPTTPKRKSSPHSPSCHEPKREDKGSRKEKERKTSPSSPSSPPSSSSNEINRYLLGFQILYSDSRFVTGSSSVLVRDSISGLVNLCNWLVSGLVNCLLVSSVTGSGSGPSAGTQGSATQDPHIAASDSSSDFDVMEGYPMQQHPESSSQDMHALGQQPGISMFSRLKETLSRATRSEHATNEINEGGGEVHSPFTSQIDPVLSESVHVSTPATTPIGLSKLTPSETLLPDGRSLAEVQEVKRYILAAREKEIESLCKAEQRRATLAKAPMTSTNPLQTPKLTTLKSQPIGSHIASGSKDTPNAAILDGVFLNENWEYNLQTEKLTDLYTSYTYHVGWLDVIQATSNSTSVDEQQRMICDVIHSIVQRERQNLGINMPSMGPMRFLDTTKAKQPTISQMETPSVSPMDPSYIVSPGVSMQSEPTHGSFSFPDLVQPSLGDLPTPTMNMTGGAPSTSLASTTPLHTSVAPLPIPIGVHQPYVPVATHPYVAPMPPPNPTAIALQRVGNLNMLEAAIDRFPLLGQVISRLEKDAWELGSLKDHLQLLDIGIEGKAFLARKAEGAQRGSSKEDASRKLLSLF
ncbi:hypothetical protein L7F22_013731 [Adiantum nelumboides]|nr:hypothetical protein [Adiantum nelumboides]